ncbi:hypothetical protein MTR67_012290, partial [Solanum verrucosum]
PIVSADSLAKQVTNVEVRAAFQVLAISVKTQSNREFVVSVNTNMVAYSRNRMSKFVSGVSKIVVKECRTTMLINEIYISRLMVHAQQIEEDELKERSREAKRAKTGDSDF